MSEGKISFVDVPGETAALRDELLSAFQRVLDHGRFILGEEVAAFERLMEAEAGFPEGSVIAVSSGTDALLSALMAHGVGPGDRVVTTPFSFFATAGVIARLGARPFFVDIDPVTLNLDPRGLEALNPEDFKALLIVHVFGRTADVDGCRAWCDAGDVPLIEDAAQAVLGKNTEGVPVGLLGAVGCFSCFPTKNLGAAGDAGFQVATAPDMAERLRTLRTHGQIDVYDSVMVGGNFRMDALQAALLCVKLPHLKRWTRSRRRRAERYDRGFRGRGLDRVLALPPMDTPETWVVHQYVIRCRERDRLRRHLAEHGIESQIYYPKPLHRMEAFASLGETRGPLPEADRACEEVLALPVSPRLSEAAQTRVIEAVAAFDGFSSSHRRPPEEPGKMGGIPGLGA